MNRFLVVIDFITDNCPLWHSGHSQIPSFGEFVPKIVYFLFFAENETNPFSS